MTNRFLDLSFYNTIRDIQNKLYDLQDIFDICYELFPINITSIDKETYQINLNNTISFINRTKQLLEILTKYWDFTNNKPGEDYSFNLWMEMMILGFRFGDPPPH